MRGISTCGCVERENKGPGMQRVPRLIPNYRCFKPPTCCWDHMELYTQVKQVAERALSFKSLKINPGLGIFSSAGRIPA